MVQLAHTCINTHKSQVSQVCPVRSGPSYVTSLIGRNIAECLPLSRLVLYPVDGVVTSHLRPVIGNVQTCPQQRWKGNTETGSAAARRCRSIHVIDSTMRLSLNKSVPFHRRHIRQLAPIRCPFHVFGAGQDSMGSCGSHCV